ncbi:oxygenase MpaB family protein [Prauserella halophila]|uniref:Oxygenase MpaB family protein n=1 Tax=Prauserella halophila TaxID=185641 RepID=A0ABN1W820_9PSEU|nr:oxygenase MpaB family protein [Prauserella halophila]MCP2236264.1 hypothetical protein (DUF2236) [Prauserella halophila]
MTEFSRRRALISGGGLAALGALVATSPAQARSLVGWNWSPSRSVVGTGDGGDPHRVWDSEADPLLEALFDRGVIGKVNELLWNWERNDQSLPNGLPSDLREFMEHARRLPEWADHDKLDRAAEFNKSRGSCLNVCNGLGGGLLATAIPKEARAVYYSAGGADMEDRVAKTSLFGFAVGSLDAYRPEGTCVVECVKTRLVHAAVRHLLPQSPHWAGRAAEEIPISQEDMLVTWHTLPTFAMRTMREWEVPISDGDAEAYLHLWQVTAYLLGIADEYIPATWDAAYAQSDQILARNMGPTPEGVKLTDILLGQLAEQTSPASLSRPQCNAMARYLIGDRVADWDGIQREPLWDRVIPEAWTMLVKFREGLVPLPAVPEIAWTIDEAMRQYLLLHLTKGEETKIEIPTHNRPE